MTSLVMKNGIILKSLDDTPTLAPDAIELKMSFLTEVKKIKGVTSLPMEEIAVEVLRMGQDLKRGMEKCRKDRKERPWQQCKSIDGLANDFNESLDAGIAIIKSHLSAYALKKEKEAQELERQRQEELKKIEDERRKKDEEAEKAAKAQADAEAEAERLRAVAEGARTAKAREAAEKLAQAAQERADAEAKKLADAAREAQAKEDQIRESLPVIAAKASGAATKFVFKYEVININDLFAHAPHVVELTEKKSAVNSLINGMAMADPEQVPKVPGLRIWKEADVNTRSR